MIETDTLLAASQGEEGGVDGAAIELADVEDVVAVGAEAVDDGDLDVDVGEEPHRAMRGTNSPVSMT